MRVLGAKIFQPVGREVDDHNAAFGTQDPCRLGNGPRRPIGEVEHLMDDHCIHGRRGKRQVVHVAAPDLTVGEPARLQPRLGGHQHLAAEVKAEAAIDPRGKDLEEAGGAGADVEEIADRPPAKLCKERSLDLRFGDVEGADLIPATGVGAEVFGRRGGARLLDRGQPFEVARQGLVVCGDMGKNIARETPLSTVFGQSIKHPGALAIAFHEPGIGQNLEVTRNPGLTLTDRLGELGNRELGLGAQRQQPEPGRLGRRPQSSQHGIHRRK